MASPASKSQSRPDGVAVPGVLNDREMGQLSNALKAEDLKRRIEDAKALLKADKVN